MEKEVGLAYKLVIDLIITSVVLGAVISFMVISNKAVSTRELHKAVKINTETYAELHEYDNRVINGSDVVDIILNYSRIYDFTVNLPEGKIYFNSNAESELVNGKPLGLSLWTRDNIEKTLGNNIHSRFIVELKDTDGTYIIGLIFTEESEYNK